MASFETEIQQDIDWRLNEISIIRMLPHNSHLKGYQKELIIKYSTVAIYALWEGFVITILSLYIRKINEKGLDHKNIHLSLITHDVDIKMQLQDARQHFETKKKFVNEMHNYFNSPLSIAVSIPVDNVNLKQLNSALLRLNIPLMDIAYKPRLDKLVMIRNDVAHGENSIKTSLALVDELRSTVLDAINDLAIIVIDAYKDQQYLKR